MEIPTFTCSICGEVSQRICVYCTKDACGNHLCERCNRCSDCCECDTLFKPEQQTRALNGASKTGDPISADALPDASNGKL
jgi:hypothetical protein